MNKFAERLKELRTENNLSIVGLAKAIGTNHANISRWESKERLPNIDAVILIAKFFGVSTDYLLGVVD